MQSCTVFHLVSTYLFLTVLYPTGVSAQTTCTFDQLTAVIPPASATTCTSGESPFALGSVCYANCTTSGLTRVQGVFVCSLTGNWVGDAFSCVAPPTCTFTPLYYELFNYTLLACSNGASNIPPIPYGVSCLVQCRAPGNPEPEGQIACVLETPTHAVFEMYPILDCSYPPTCNYSLLAEQLPANVSVVCDAGPPVGLAAVGTVCSTNCTEGGYTGSANFTCIGQDDWVGCLTCDPVACPALSSYDNPDIENCVGTFYPGEHCELDCGRGDYKLCPGSNGEVKCVGIAPGVSEWQGAQRCCREHSRRERHTDRGHRSREGRRGRH